MIFLADRDPAAGHDQVRLPGGPPHRVRGRVERVADQAEIDDVATHRAQQAVQHVTIRIVDLAAFEGLPGLDQLVAGKEYADAHRRINRQGLQTNRCGQADILRAQAVAGVQNRIAAADIVARRAHVAAARRPGLELDGVAALCYLFLHDHRVGALGHRRTGKYPRRAARRQGRGRAAGRNALRHRQPGRAVHGEIGGVDRVTVHRRHRAAGYVDGRLERSREHRAERVAQRSLDDIDAGRDIPRQLLERVVVRQQGRGITAFHRGPLKRKGAAARNRRCTESISQPRYSPGAGLPSYAAVRHASRRTPGAASGRPAAPPR